MRASRGLLLLPALLLLVGGLFFLRGHERVPSDDALPPDRGAQGARPRAALARAPVSPPPARVGPGPTNRRSGRGEGEAPGVLGRVIDAAGRPLSSATLEVRALDRRGRAAGVLARATADAEGAFRIPVGSDAAWLEVSARSPGHARGTAWSPGRGVFLEIVCGAAGTLSVLALDDDGRPVPGAVVAVTVERTRAEVETDAEGRATLTDLPAGAAWIRAVAPEARAEGSTGPVPVGPDAPGGAVVWLAATVRVGGRVVDADTGLPVAGAEVHVARPGRATPAGLTAADGTFEPVLAGPPGTRATIAVRAPGYAPVLQPLPLVPTDGVLDAEIRLQRAPAWKGRVVDAGGRAVEGARVTTTQDGIQGRPAPVAVTGPDGGFELPPPPPPAPGRQVVLVARGDAGEAALALRPGQAAPSDLVLVLGRGATVRGRVLDPEGKGLANAAVRLDPLWRRLPDRRAPGSATSRLLAMNAAGRGTLQAPSGPDGFFRIDDVPDGTFRLRLLRGARQSLVEAPFEIRGGRDLDLGDVTFAAGYEVRGRVRGSDGALLSGVAIALGTRGAAPLVLHATTDGEGGFVLRGAPAGPATLTCRHPTHRPLQAPVDVGAPGSEALDLEMAAGARVEGVVRDGQKPYRGVFVVEFEAAPGSRRGRVPRSTHRASDGRFVRQGVPDGAWRVRVRTPDGRTAATPGAVDLRSGGRWEVALTLEAGARLDGTLRTAGGAPVPSGRIELRGLDDGRRRRLTTDAGGRYAAQGLPAGAYRITADGAGGASAEEEVDLLAGQRRSLDLVLRPSGAVEVEVEDDAARPLAGVVLLARKIGGRYLRPGPGKRIRTDASGRARLPDLPLGEIQIVARTADGRGARGTVRITGGKAARLVLAVPKAD